MKQHPAVDHHATASTLAGSLMPATNKPHRNRKPPGQHNPLSTVRSPHRLKAFARPAVNRLSLLALPLSLLLLQLHRLTRACRRRMPRATAARSTPSPRSRRVTRSHGRTGMARGCALLRRPADVTRGLSSPEQVGHHARAGRQQPSRHGHHTPAWRSSSVGRHWTRTHTYA